MCGICGFWSDSLGPTSTEKNIELMIHSLRHRGPDGQGKINLENDRLYFGHTRLSILDLSESGKQPMTYRNRYTISYNGEIFNFIELREELISLGHSFTSSTDTEVILAAYAQWGSDCLPKFNGMWAFAIWDDYEKVLFLSRDRYGIKPLYYSVATNDSFIFASETIAFKGLSNFKPNRSEKLLSLHLKDLNPIEASGLTTYSNIKQVKPGCFLKIKNFGKYVDERKWWDQKDHLVDVPHNYEEQVNQFKELLFDSCKLRLRSDVPIASAVSGGLDSSSIFAILNHTEFQNRLRGNKRISENFQKGFFVSFPGTYSDEKRYADEVFNHCGSNFSTIIHQPHELPDLILKTTEHFDTIYWTPLCTLTPLYQKIADEKYKISLDGHGVDEMLFGYTDMLRKLSCASRDAGHQLYADKIHEVETQLTRDPNNASQNPYFHDGKYSFKHRIPLSAKFKISAGRIRNLLFPHSSKQWKHLEKPDLGPNEPPPGFESFDPISQEFFFKTTLPTILRNFDRASMYHGVEVRMPFMDYRLVSFVISLPTTSKVKDGYTKAILRDSMNEILPDSIRKRKWKVGITAPLANWFSDNHCSNFIRDMVHSSTFQNSALWDGKVWKRRIEHLRTEQDWLPHADELWRLINAEILMNN